MKPDHVKEVIVTAADLALLISESANGFSFSEVTQIIKLIVDLQGVIKDFPVAVSEYKSLSDNDRAELIDFIKKQVSFPANIQIEKVIEKVLEVGVVLSVLFTLLQPE